MGTGTGVETYTVKEQEFPHVQYEEMRETPFNYLEIFTHKKASHTVPSFFFCSDDAFT